MKQIWTSGLIASLVALGTAACSSAPAKKNVIGGGTNQATSGSGGAGGSSTAVEGGLFGAGGTGVTPTGGASGLPEGGGLCAGQKVAAEPLPIDMYFMFDQSSSMADTMQGDSKDKWTGVVNALTNFVQNPRARALRVGIQYFGQPDVCNPAPYATPDVEIQDMATAAPLIIQSLQRHGPSTLTPTYPALQGAIQHAQQWATAHPERATVVVLVTDGYPTQCDAKGTLWDPQNPSMLAPAAQITEIAALAEAAVKGTPKVLTFVVGIDGVDNLNAIAQSGGTGKAFLINAGDVTQQFTTAMLSISNTPLSCDLGVPQATDPNKPVDYNKVQVVYTPAAGSATQLVKVNTLGDCSLNGGSGWYYDTPTDPKHIFICPGSCSAFAAGTVEIKLGCEPMVGILH